MRIKVLETCTGHGRCYVVAPSVYQADDEGYNVAIGHVVDVPDDLVEDARRGVANCPERALVIIDGDSAAPVV